MLTLSHSERRLRRQLAPLLPASLRAVAEWADYHTPAAARFRPTPTDHNLMLPVLGWLAKHAQEPGGERGVEIIIAKALGIPILKLQQRWNVSPNTVRRWETLAVEGIAMKRQAALEGML